MERFFGDPGDVVYFGRTDFRNTNRLFGIKRRDRRQHMYVVGKTGTGKSVLLQNMAVQDIVNGEGICIIDPHGELVEGILSKIPENRLSDVIYFNPADPDYHIGFNVLELRDSKHKHLIASGLMSIFTKIWSNVWSARMEYILNNAVLALLEVPGSTLLGINRILVDKDYRQSIISKVQDPVVRAFWVNEYELWRDQFRNEAIAPIQNKVGQFLSTSMIRNIVGQQKSTIDIFDIMNTRKIFLVNVSKGRIGEDNSALLGAMLITKIQLGAMERVRVPEEERADFYLYVDEFQNFATDAFAGILSEARKYRLNLVLAHQYVGQLVTDVSTKVRDAVFGNVGTMLVFRVGASDAEFLENEFSPELTIEDIVNLPNYCTYLKLMVDGVTSRPFSAATLPPFKLKESAATAEKIVAQSRKLYTKPQERVEKEIKEWASSMGDVLPSAVSGTASPEAVRQNGRAPSGSGVKYSAVCDSCSKTTELNFRPTEGRAIYCRECLAKVQSGEIPRVKVKKIKTPHPTEESFADLAGIGIEFKGEELGQEKREKRSEEGGAIPRAGLEALVRGGKAEEVRESGPKGAMSLNELKRIETVPKEKKSKGVNIGELRDAIREALGNRESAREGGRSEEKKGEQDAI